MMFWYSILYHVKIASGDLGLLGSCHKRMGLKWEANKFRVQQEPESWSPTGKSSEEEHQHKSSKAHIPTVWSLLYDPSSFGFGVQLHSPKLGFAGSMRVSQAAQ